MKSKYTLAIAFKNRLLLFWLSAGYACEYAYIRDSLTFLVLLLFDGKLQVCLL